MLTERSSGILMHITSLPSPFGVGDLGNEAYDFVDLLRESNTRYWQLLPLSPTIEAFGFSPYSSLSAFACNTLLISPEMLYREGLLDKKDVEVRPAKPTSKADFNAAVSLKKPLLEKAWQNFKRQKGQEGADYKSFCKEHKLWLEDYALFVALSDENKGKAWNKWAQPLRNRSQQALEEARKALKEQVEKEKFLQLQFFRQWKMLKAYCKEKEVRLFGDLPFYLNLNSADIWSFPQYFKLDKDKKPLKVSGVPPDYFSESGQLWGTPVYDWEQLERDRFVWWKYRVLHNFKFFDLLRLDHFRAFSACWEVPASEQTAVNGEWRKVPGEDFFRGIKRLRIEDKIVAEDLGDIDQPVVDLIKKFNFPGMKVLQFAFEDKEHGNLHVPYAHERNYVVYSATHDNNTSRGWFENEAKEEDLKNLRHYLGHKVDQHNIAHEMVRMCLGSVANLAIVPVQDLLGLGQEAIMNRPGTASGNWQWRLLPGQVKQEHIKLMKALNDFYWRNRGPIEVH